MTPLFLTAEELRELTGFAIKEKQIAQLRTMSIPFRINGHGKPIVTRAVIEGMAEPPKQTAWRPSVLQIAR